MAKMKWICPHQGLIAHAQIGWIGPNIHFQITPFSWGFGLCVYWKKSKRLTAQVGPFSFALETSFGVLSRSWPGNQFNTQWREDGTWKPSNEFFTERDVRMEK